MNILEAKRAKAGKYEKPKSLFDNILRKRASARKSRKTPFQAKRQFIASDGNFHFKDQTCSIGSPVHQPWPAKTKADAGVKAWLTAVMLLTFIKLNHP